MKQGSVVPARALHLPALSALGLLLAACNFYVGNNVDGSIDYITAYESRGTLQCQGGGSTPQQSAQKLAAAGIDVLRSGCGVMTGVAFAQFCGGPTGDILLHEIPKAKLADAKKLGFEDAATLRNSASGTDYQWVDCETGATIP